MDKPKTTAKDFFLWAGFVVSFYGSVIAYTYLIFDYINYVLPNPLSYYPVDPYQGGISYEMASIIVLLPLSMFLFSLIRKDIALDPSRKDIWVRRWALILTLFVAAVSIAVDLITLLTTFLNGEALTTAFLLKVLVIFIVAGKVFWYFILDLRGYWDQFPGRQRMVSIGVGVVALVTIIAGFFIVGTPAQARLARFDAQKVSDLQNIQSQVIYYWQAKQQLPVTLRDLASSLSYGPVPVDAQTGTEYVYEATGDLSFKLCADFNKEGSSNRNDMSRYPAEPMPIGGKVMTQDNWQHASGQVCFDRTIDPSFYPPIKN